MCEIEHTCSGPEIELYKVVNFFLLNVLNVLSQIIVSPFFKKNVF